jgi:hypothetical protein
MGPRTREFVYLSQHLKRLRGGSQPILARASDGLTYVVKFTNNPQGPNLPFNECMGSALYGGCRLSVPEWRPLLVTESFIEQNPACWIQTPEGPQRPSAGWCFGSCFLDRNGFTVTDILPRSSFKRVRNRRSFWLAWMLDICAEHVDHRQALFIDQPDGGWNAFFYDHGHLFGGPEGNSWRHFVVSQYLDPQIYPGVSSHWIQSLPNAALRLDTDLLWKRAQVLPEEWKTPTALQALSRTLRRLSSLNLLQAVAKTILESLQGSERIEHTEPIYERKQPASVLCSGLPATASNQLAIGSGVGAGDCA